MKKQSFFSKLFASFALVSGSIWIGSYLVKLFLIYQLFEPKDLVLKEMFSINDINIVIFSLLPAFITPFLAYIIMIISFVLFLLFSKISIKENGWLFISIMIIFITLPFEFYLLVIDYKIISLLLQSSFNTDSIIILVRDRITALSSFPIIEILSYLSILFLIIFKPLTVKNKVT
ncbi:MAG: hypothetical protein MUO34_01165 [Ignavibacteriaceae bacterium]|nr:hypothetical protein [Ignavibacteriaceae bacterium]